MLFGNSRGLKVIEITSKEKLQNMPNESSQHVAQVLKGLTNAVEISCRIGTSSRAMTAAEAMAFEKKRVLTGPTRAAFGRPPGNANWLLSKMDQICTAKIRSPKMVEKHRKITQNVKQPSKKTRPSGFHYGTIFALKNLSSGDPKSAKSHWKINTIPMVGKVIKLCKNYEQWSQIEPKIIQIQ